MKSCPNCDREHGCAVWDNKGFFVICPRCGMRGPRADGPNNAICAWDALPRRGDYLSEIGRMGDYAEALGRVRGMCAGLAWNVKELDYIGETLTQERVLRWLDAIARAATPEDVK